MFKGVKIRKTDQVLRIDCYFFIYPEYMIRDIDRPRLIETGTHSYLTDTLKQCHTTRVGVYYYVLNFGVFFLFVSLFAAFLYYSHLQKKSDYEKKQKMIRDQEYILSKIRFYQENAQMRNEQQSSITTLPNI
jgi:hypothetical protein